MNILKYLMIKFYNTLVILTFITFGLISCSPKPEVVVNVQTLTQKASEGLDLKKVGELLPSIKDSNELEQKLNDHTLGLNRLDLNGDGKVDIIKVKPFQKEDKKGFILLDEMKPGELTELATIEIKPQEDGKKADVVIKGNENQFGAGHQITSVVNNLATFFLFSQLMSSFGRGGQTASQYAPSYPPQTEGLKSKVDWSSKKSEPQTVSEQRKPTTETRSIFGGHHTQKEFKVRENRAIRYGGFGRPERSNPSSIQPQRSFFSQRGKMMGGRSFGRRR